MLWGKNAWPPFVYGIQGAISISISFAVPNKLRGQVYDGDRRRMRSEEV
jgi:hypothetical protein